MIKCFYLYRNKNSLLSIIWDLFNVQNVGWYEGQWLPLNPVHQPLDWPKKCTSTYVTYLVTSCLSGGGMYGVAVYSLCLWEHRTGHHPTKGRCELHMARTMKESNQIWTIKVEFWLGHPSGLVYWLDNQKVLGLDSGLYLVYNEASKMVQSLHADFRLPQREGKFHWYNILFSKMLN